MAENKLLTDPEGYARRAVEVLDEQLVSCKSRVKAARLNRRKTEWQKLLNVLQETDGHDEKDAK